MDTLALATEAAKKSSVAWVCAAGSPAQAFWYVSSGLELFVVTGGDEQIISAFDSPGPVSITFRSKHNGSAVVIVEGTLETLTTGTEAWDEAAGQLSPKRLNASTNDLESAWREKSQVHKITLTTVSAAAGAFAENSSALANDGGREAVRQSPAGTGRPLPFHLGKRSKRKQGT